MLADDRNGLRGRDVIARNPIFFSGDRVEMFLDNLFSTREPVASAHSKELWQIEVSEGSKRLRATSGIRCNKGPKFLREMVDLVGIEPTTSSMPFNPD